MTDLAAELPDMHSVEVVAPHFKRRLSGVTSTVIQLIPLQAKALGIATLGPGLPGSLPKMRWRQVPALLKPPAERPFRIWHARRNTEMLAGVVLKHLFHAPLRLVFTSASQRHHTRWSRFLISRMDAVVATSRRTGSYLRVPHEVVMHGIDTARFSPPAEREAAIAALGLDPRQHYAGCFGRIRHQKGTDLFVDAMLTLLPKYPRWSAIVAGQATGPHEAYEVALKEKVRAAGLGERILFVGTQADIPPWYRALSLFVAPQRWEGFGLTPLEAMATGVPVVATDVGAFSELVEEGVTGRVIPAGDLAAMTGAVERYMSDDRAREAAGRAALAHVQSQFPLEREAEALRGVYERLWRTAG